MIDPKKLRDNPEFYKKNYEMRRKPEYLKMVDDYLGFDQTWRDLDKEVNELRHQRNEGAKKIKGLKGKEKQAEIGKMKQVNSDLADVEAKMKEAETQRQWVLDRMPNLLHDTVPYGADDEDNVTMRTWGEIPTFDFEPKSSHELMELLDIVELERARKISGARFYFLKGKGAILEMALIRYAMDIVMKAGFELHSTPTLVRTQALYGTGYLPTGEEDIYKIQGEDLALIGTSEVPLGSMYADETIVEDQLPIWLAGFSNCYRTEASASTKDDKGIFRVHEFKKVEMFKFVKPETSWDEQEHLLSVIEQVFQGLELPYRVVNICTGDIGFVAARKFDVEAWMPGQNKYREVGSCSNCTDYQARRLNVKYREVEGAPPKEFVHTLNSTALATTRPIISILENFQQADGSVLIPKVLHKYTGFKSIKPKTK